MPLKLKYGTVTWETPECAVLKQNGWLCVDLHTHTNYSDGSATISEVVTRARNGGFGVAITDHNEFSGSKEASRQKDAVVIPGMEFNSFEGPDLLFYFFNQQDLASFWSRVVKGNLRSDPHGRTNVRVAQMCELSRSFKCVVVTPHPFCVAWKNLPSFLERQRAIRLLDDIDAIEVLNGQQSKETNFSAIAWNEKLRKAITGGSDAHTAQELGSVVTCAKADSVSSFLRAIQKKRTAVVGNPKWLTVMLGRLACLYNHRQHASIDSFDLLIKHARHRFLGESLGKF